MIRSRRSRVVLPAAVLLVALAALLSGCATGRQAPPPQPVTLHRDVVYGHGPGGQALTENVYAPTHRRGPLSMVILVHGGGFDVGTDAGTSSDAASLALGGFLVFNVNYTLSRRGAPGYPDQVHEIEQAIRFDHAGAARFGGQADRLALVGFSAGGYLAAQSSVLADDASARPVKAVVTLSAPLDFVSMQRLFAERYARCRLRTSCPQVSAAPSLATFQLVYGFLGCQPSKCSGSTLHQASPVYNVSRDSPPFLIFNSAHEIVPAGQAAEMHGALSAQGVAAQTRILSGSAHGAAYLPRVSATIVSYLRGRLGVAGVQPATAAPAAIAPEDDATLIVVCAALIVIGLIALVLTRARRRREAST